MPAQDNQIPTPEDKILDLDELIEPVGEFRLEKKDYHFIEMGALGLIKQKEIDNLWAKIREIREKPKPTAKEEIAYENHLRKLLPMISDLPASVAKKAPLQKILMAAITFFSFRTASQVALVMRMAQIQGKGDQLIGGNSSPDSIISGLSQTPKSG